ncbi:hypothetical protein A2316_03370 [Candidatus Falkowbacteria bacterium RIFOXYB2_FULL_38_15]|nr:MAG: hypothetical protein A2316_03370 [Candidatus Falkowbacteria bacterium RIFOXYB2_FULL_38_15]OGF42643.1 MAG: hypothetical protein A2555_02570 [Candidatus Falkowbacteria bacterium RIFOXYD2_FULL_39_16]
MEPGVTNNVPAYAMFASGIICPKGDRWQIWVEACGGTEQAVTAYAVLAEIFLFFSTIVVCFKKFSNFFFRFGLRAEGIKG